MKKTLLLLVLTWASFSFLNKDFTLTIIENKQQVTIVDVLQPDHSIPLGFIELRDHEEYKTPVRDKKSTFFSCYYKNKIQFLFQHPTLKNSFLCRFNESRLYIAYCSFLI